MFQDRFVVIRQTKLDLAQWITAGIGKCAHPATSLALARYAAAQLEMAARIPSEAKRGQGLPARSLLRDEIRRSQGTTECFAVLNSVSHAMLHLLAGSSARERSAALQDIRTSTLIRHELQAARALFESLPRKSAA